MPFCRWMDSGGILIWNQGECLVFAWATSDEPVAAVMPLATPPPQPVTAATPSNIRLAWLYGGITLTQCTVWMHWHLRTRTRVWLYCLHLRAASIHALLSVQPATLCWSDRTVFPTPRVFFVNFFPNIRYSQWWEDTYKRCLFSIDYYYFFYY